MNLRFLEPRPLPIAWAEQEEDWWHHLMTALSDLVPMTGSGRTLVRAADDLPLHYRVRVKTDHEIAPLLLIPQPDGVHAAVPLVEGQSPSVAAPWEVALPEAVRRLGSGIRKFDWFAYVGTAYGALARDCTVGSMTLARSTGPFTRYVTSAHPSFSGASGEWTYPVKTEGVVQGLLWDTSASQASQDLYRLCALLSVAFDCLWVVLQAPQPSDLYPDPGPPPHPPFEDHPTESGNLSRQEHEPPVWLALAWDRTDVLSFAGPLSAYYRGLQLEQSDPATALLLFVAAVEGIGALLVDLKTCDACGGKKGAAKRFRKGLRLAHDKEAAKKLDSAYGKRSKPAHGELLEGQPRTVKTWTDVGMFYASPEARLSSEVWDMRQAARRVLEVALTDPSFGDASQESTDP